MKLAFSTSLFLLFFPALLSCETAQARPDTRSVTPSFSFSTALEGRVEDFARGESVLEREQELRDFLQKKYGMDASGHFTAAKETRLRQDYNARELTLINKYDPKNHDTLGDDEVKVMKQIFYERRLAFMKSFDKNNDGYLDRAETAAMRLEWNKRRAAFFDHFDRS